MKYEYGLIGEKLGHSYSKLIHEEFGYYKYELIELKKDKLKDFITSADFKGLNVTIPYKKDVIPFCSEITPAAQKIGSVNTLLKRRDGTLLGDNTDYYGFLYMASLAGIDFNGKKVLVLGSGGTSLTAKTAVLDRGGKPIIISRSGENNYENISKHTDADIIVNTTPLGMYPHTAEKAVDLKIFNKLTGVLDVIYNPYRTRLLQQADELSIKNSGGIAMLVAQAKRAAEIFTGETISDDVTQKIINKILKDTLNLVFIGMPGCGKSSIGKKVAKKLSRNFYDVDSIITKNAKMTIPEIFEKYGEDGFRKLESEVLDDLCKLSGKAISTGGGAVLAEENRRNIIENSFVVHIKRNPEYLSTKGRPLSKDRDAILKMEKERMPIYEQCADVSISNNSRFELAVNKVLEAFNENTCY